MRTTLDIEPDVLAAAKTLAAQKKTTVGKVISDLARQSLEPTCQYTIKSGVPVFPKKVNSQPIDIDLVNSLRDE